MEQKTASISPSAKWQLVANGNAMWIDLLRKSPMMSVPHSAYRLVANFWPAAAADAGSGVSDPDKAQNLPRWNLRR